MNYVAGWRAYYSGGAVYRSATTPIASLPQTGLLVWMLYFTDGTRRIMHGNDRCFWYNNGSTDGVYATTDETVVQINDRYPGAYIIEGELVSEQEFNDTIELAMRTKVP